MEAKKISRYPSLLRTSNLVTYHRETKINPPSMLKKRMLSCEGIGNPFGLWEVNQPFVYFPYVFAEERHGTRRRSISLRSMYSVPEPENAHIVPTSVSSGFFPRCAIFSLISFFIDPPLDAVPG